MHGLAGPCRAVFTIRGLRARYAATSDLSPHGLAEACDRARSWAQLSAKMGLIDTRTLTPPAPEGHYASPVAQSADTVSLADKVSLLQDLCGRLRGDERIVDAVL